MTIHEQFLPQILKALEQYAAYMHATNRDPGQYRAIADQLRQAQHQSRQTQDEPPRRYSSRPAQPMSKTASPQRLPPFEEWFIFRMRLDLSDM